jgi:hypothetical protein
VIGKLTGGVIPAKLGLTWMTRGERWLKTYAHKATLMGPEDKGRTPKHWAKALRMSLWERTEAQHAQHAKSTMTYREQLFGLSRKYISKGLKYPDVSRGIGLLCRLRIGGYMLASYLLMVGGVDPRRYKTRCVLCDRPFGDGQTEVEHLVLTCDKWERIRRETIGVWIARFRLEFAGRDVDHGNVADPNRQLTNTELVYLLEGGTLRYTAAARPKALKSFVQAGKEDAAGDGSESEDSDLGEPENEAKEEDWIGGGVAEPAPMAPDASQRILDLEEEKEAIYLADGDHKANDVAREDPVEQGNGSEEPLFVALARFLQRVEPLRRRALAEFQKAIAPPSADAP